MHINDIKKLKNFGNYRFDMQLNGLNDKVNFWIKEDNLELIPNFQRGHVWTPQQRISFVEFILKGGITNPIIFNHPGWMSTFKGNFVCVDGLQRLTALNLFLDNKLIVFGDHYRSEIEGIESLLKSIMLKVYINDLKTDNEVIEWYLELNSGGTQHSKEDLDKARSCMV